MRRSRTKRQEGSSASLLEVCGGEGAIRTDAPWKPRAQGALRFKGTYDSWGESPFA